jgi:hypothetical protein
VIAHRNISNHTCNVRRARRRTAVPVPVLFLEQLAKTFDN